MIYLSKESSKLLKFKMTSRLYRDLSVRGVTSVTSVTSSVAGGFGLFSKWVIFRAIFRLIIFTTWFIARACKIDGLEKKTTALEYPGHLHFILCGDALQLQID